MTKKQKGLCWIGFSFGLFSMIAGVQAETIELVTYFPAGAAAGGGDQQTRSIRVGNAYAARPAPPNGVAVIEDRLGIGLSVLGGAPIDPGVNPAGVLHVMGLPDALDRVLFLPGPDTAAAGVPEIRVGIGTAGPAGELHVVADDANSDVFVERTGATASIAMVTAQGDLAAIGAFSDDPLALTTSNIPRIFIRDAAGNNATDGFVGIGNFNAANLPAAPLQVGASNLFVQADQGGNLEIGGSNAIPNPVANGMPYLDFHFGLTDAQGATVAQDFNARLINRADGILDVQTSTAGAAPLTSLSIGNNVGIGTIAPQGTAPGGGTTGNLDANDLFVRSANRWVSEMDAGILEVKTATQTGNTAAYQNDDTLFFNVGANQLWQYEFMILFFVNANSDIKFRIQTPPLNWIEGSGLSNLAPESGVFGRGGQYVAGDLSSSGMEFDLDYGLSHYGRMHIVGAFQTGANGGIIRLQWAKGRNGGNSCFVFRGSYVKARRAA